MNSPPTHHGTRLANLTLRNAVPMNLMFIILVIVGALVIRKMPVDVYPDVALGEVTLDTIWLGASAEDVERLITDRIEDKIQDNRGIAWIVSDSKPDASLIRVKFREELSASGLDAAIRELRADVDQVDDLPEDAREPVLTKLSMDEVFFLLWVTVVDEGAVGEEVLHEAALRLKRLLRELPGVGKVDDLLIRDREVHLKADRDAMRKHGLTLRDLGDLLQQNNRNLPSGTMHQKVSELSIRAQSGVRSPEELGETVVLKSPDGGHVHLRDVATIETGFARKTFFARADQKDCLALGIAKSKTADSRAVAQRVRDALPAFKETLPPGVGLKVFNDASDIISNRLSILTANLGSGVVLVFLVLWVAVGLRNSILAIIGIPFSFCCALICMHLLGVTINAISLIGLVLCAGMIVDDAIVVLENIYRLVQKRRVSRADRPALLRAIGDGAGEVLWPVVVSSATTVAAFLPLLLMTGMVGQFFAIIPKTVTVVLLASLFECLLILPVHYVDFGRRMPVGQDPEAANQAPRAPGEGLGRGTRFYDRCLGVVLRHRYVTFLPVLALAFLAFAAAPMIRVELFPSDLRICMLDVQATDEASLDQTGEAAREIERIVLSLTDRVSGVLTSYGMMVTDENAVKLRNNVAQMHIQLARTGRFDSDPTSVIQDLRRRIDRYLADNKDSGIQGYRIWAPRAGPPTGKPVYVRIESPDFRTSKLLAEQYKATLSDMGGVFGIKDNLEFGRQQLNLQIDEDLASLHGLTFLALASVLRTANDGLVVSTFKDADSGEDLDVRLRLDDRYCQRVEDLLDLDIRTPAGYTIQLGQIAHVKMDQGYAAIPHHDGRRAVTVSAEADAHVITSQEINEHLIQTFAPILASMPNVNVVYGGQFAETESSFESLKEAYVVAFVLIYFLLATQFGSYLQPLVILSTAPFASVGVVAGLLLSGYPFTVMTFIGVVGMTGVVVNDSILLVDCFNVKRVHTDDLFVAVRAACTQRLRPILLTTITTVLGLLPLAIGLGGQSRIWSPFASSFAWGLMFATLITLFLIPAVYCIAQDLIGLFTPSPSAPAPENSAPALPPTRPQALHLDA